MSVEQNLEQILSARYGKDVRQSIHDAIYDINEVAKDAEYHASTAPTSAQAYANAALAAEQAAQQAKQDAEAAAEQAMSGTPTGYDQVVAEVRSLETNEDTVLAEVGTFAGRVLLDKMYGMSIQDGTPTPSVPVAINSAKANFKNCGKNLLVLAPDTSGTINYQVGTDESLTIISNTNTSDVVLKLNKNNKYVAKTTKSLKLTGCSSGGSANTYSLRVVDTTASGYSEDIGNGVTFTPTVGHEYEVCIFIKANYSMSNVVFKPMLAYTDADQTFEPYQGQSVTTDLVLRAIKSSNSDYKYNLIKDGVHYLSDVLNKVDNGYQKIANIDRLFLDGTEGIAWTVLQESGTTDRIAFVTSGSSNTTIKSFFEKVKVRYIPTIISNRFVIAEGYKTNVAGMVALYTITATGVSYLKFRISDTITTSTEFNTWLTTHNVELLYELATPTVETVSNADAKKLLSLKSYDEATYIAQTEDTEGECVLMYGSTELSNMAVTGYVEGEQNSVRLSDLESAV